MGQRDEDYKDILVSSDCVGSANKTLSMEFQAGKYYAIAESCADALIALGKATAASPPGGTPKWVIHLVDGANKAYWQVA